MKAKVGDVVCFSESMVLCGQVVTVRPTPIGKRYHIRVNWIDGGYTIHARMWWRIWR